MYKVSLKGHPHTVSLSDTITCHVMKDVSSSKTSDQTTHKQNTSLSSKIQETSRQSSNFMLLQGALEKIMHADKIF